MYSCIFKNKLKSLIRIEAEGFEPISRDPDAETSIYKDGFLNKLLKRAIESQITYDKTFKAKPKNEYTFEEAKNRLLKGSNFNGFYVGSSIDEDHVHIMLKRGLKPGEIDKNKFIFTRDVKLIMPNFPFFTIEDGSQLIKFGYENSQ